LEQKMSRLIQESPRLIQWIPGLKW
jgi:hypothetical protein